jgi:hypothetical protein
MACGKDAELAEGLSQAGLVAELLMDGQGLAVPGLGVIRTASQVRHCAQLKVHAGDAGLVAKILLDGQSLKASGFRII